MYGATFIANNVLNRAFAERKEITPMKLQKILFFIAAEYAKQTDEKLLEEDFGVWKYGPVVYSVYSEFSSYGKRSITRYARDAMGKAFMADETADPFLKICIDRVWVKTKDKNGIELGNITHIEDSAWDKGFQAGESYIKHDDMKTDCTYRVELGIAD